MKTFLPKEQDIKKNREWYLIDAKDAAPGRVATLAAKILGGKHKPTFTPHLDTGDAVVIINAAEVYLSGNKITKKKD